MMLPSSHGIRKNVQSKLFLMQISSNAYQNKEVGLKQYWEINDFKKGENTILKYLSIKDSYLR